MLMPHLRTCLAATAVALASTTVMAAQLPVKIERFEGEVVQVVGTTHSGVLSGKNLEQGSQVQTGPDGRAELSLNGATTVAIGGATDLLVHSVEQGVLRLRAASGAMRIDSRAAGPYPARDVRLNIGDLRLRISGADAWTELTDRGGQVCLIAGVIDAQQPSGSVRMDSPGQCLRQSGLTAQWSMVPLSVLEERVGLVAVQAPKLVAAPKADPKIKTLPLPVEVAPAPVAEAPAADPTPVPVVVATPPKVEPAAPLAKPAEVAVAAAPAAAPKEEKPVAIPVKDPESPAAAGIIAVAVPTPLQMPVLPDPPAPDIKAAAVEPIAPKPQPAALPPEAPSSASVPPAQDAPPEAEVAMAAPATTALVVDDGRRWRVVVASMPEREKAETEAERLNARGWAVDAREYRVGDRHGYRIGFGEFAAREEAQKALDEFLARNPDAAVWLAKY